MDFNVVDGWRVIIVKLYMYVIVNNNMYIIHTPTHIIHLRVRDNIPPKRPLKIGEKGCWKRFWAAEQRTMRVVYDEQTEKVKRHYKKKIVISHIFKAHNLF